MPMRYGTFDIESTEWINFEVLGFFDGEQYKNFWSVKTFLNYLNKKAYNGLRIYAHNGGKFDFLFLLEEVLDRGWVQKIIDRQGRIIQLRIDTGTVRFSFVDSYALLPTSLRNLSDTFKPKHRKLEMDYTQISAHDEKTLSYLENDVLCLWEVLYDFFLSDFVVQPQLTIASQALNTFRHKFWHGEVLQMRIRHEEVIREFYYSGGRVEMYKGYGKGIRVYDVNSLFPFVMLNPMPCGEAKHVTQYAKGKPGFYHVKIGATPEWYISPLLHRNGKLIFPKGGGEYYLGSPTLEVLREEGVRFRVLEGFAFTGSEPIFTDYVHTFFKIKSENKNNALYFLSKLFLNSLYGKFGARRDRQAIVPATGYEEGALLPSAGTLLDLYGMVLVSEQSHSRFIAPYLAAYITELARIHHYKLMRQNPKAMYYCDTDSLFTTAKYKTGKGIGELSLYGEFTEGVFLGNKTYALKNGKQEKVAFRGFTTEDIRFSDVKRALIKHVPIMQERERMLGYKECMNAKTVSRSKGAFLKMRQTKKVTKALDYDKRECYLSSTGCIIDTQPLTL